LTPTPEPAIATEPRPARRDRDDDGRPEQARPRDRSGRPLPYGTDVTELVEEHAYDTLDQALAIGVDLWRRQRYFEAHECLEEVWHEAAEADREFWKGVIQVAVGAVHVQRDNPDGAVTLWNRAADYLDPYPDEHHGVDVGSLRRLARDGAVRVAAGGTAGVPLPGFPAHAAGPYVGATPDDGPHPLRDAPPWAPRV